MPCIHPSERKLIPSGNKSLIHKNCIDFQEALYPNETSGKISCLDNFSIKNLLPQKDTTFWYLFLASYMRLFLYREWGKACFYFYYYSAFIEGNILLHKTQYKMSDLKNIYLKRLGCNNEYGFCVTKLFIPFSFL